MYITDKGHYRKIVGIDPDTNECGVAVVDREGRRAEGVYSLKLAELLELMLDLHDLTDGRTLAVVEAGWVNCKSNWHPAQGRAAEKVAKNVGANHQRGRDIIELLQGRRIPVEPVPPLMKRWKGPNGKITQTELEAITGYDRRTNQDGRDALLLAWAHAELPLRIRGLRR